MKEWPANTPPKKETPEKQTKEPPFIKERLLSLLEKNDILSKNSEGIFVMDMKKFCSPDFINKFRHSYLCKINSKNIKASSHIIFEALSDLKVISTEDLAESLESEAQPRTKPLFNIPESIDEAFDPKKISSKEYYLNLWDIGKEKNLDKDIHATNGEVVNSKELFLATKLFRDFQAKRSSDGTLTVLDSESNNYVPLRTDWIIKNIGNIGTHELANSPHQFLLDNCPNLLKVGLIRIEDFKIKTGDKSGALVRKEFLLGNRTDVMINGVRYYIARNNFIFNGESIPKKNIEVVILDQNTAGIIVNSRGIKKVRYVLPLLSEDEKNIKKQELLANAEGELSKKDITLNTFVKKEEMNGRLRPWLRTQDNPRREDETPARYAERISQMSDYGHTKKLGDDFTRSAKIGIHDKLNWREQQWLASGAFDLETLGKYQELLNFSSTYGIDGLKTFISCEFDIKNGQKILDIGEKLEHERARLIFKKASEIIDLAERKSQELEDIIAAEDTGKTDISDIRFELLKKAASIITEFGQKISIGEKTEIDSLLIDLEKTKAEIILLASVLRSARKKDERINLSEIKNLKLEKREMRKSDGLSHEEKEELLAICMHNYEKVFKDNPRALARVINGFKNELENLSGQTVFILKFQGQVVAFCRFKPMAEGEMYTGSLNVTKDVQGLSVGNYFITSSINEMARDYKIKATTRKDNPANGSYQKQGFVLTQEFREEDGTEYYEMQLDKRNGLKKAA